MDKKKVIACLTALIFAFGGTVMTDNAVWSGTAITASAEDSTEGLEYTEIDGEIHITKIKGSDNYDSTDLVYHIPEKIDGKPVTAIDNDAVESGIGTVYLPKTLASIPENSEGAGLVMVNEAIYVDKDNPNFTDIDGVLFNKDKTKLLAFPNMKELFDDLYKVPDSVTELGQGSFCGAEITNVQLPEGLEVIGDHCFWCSRLLYLEVPAKVRVLDDQAFEGCCPIEYIDVSPDNENYCSVDGVLFSKDMTSMLYFPNGMSVDSYSIPDGVINIHWNCFGGVYRELNIPASVTNIDGGLGSSGVYSTTAETINVAEDNTVYHSTDGVLYSDDTLIMYPPEKKDTEYTVPDGILYIGAEALCNTAHLEYLTISEGVVSLGILGISSLENVRAVYLPSTLEHCSTFSISSFNKKFKNIYYGGTEEQFANITAGLFGDKLFKDQVENNGYTVIYNAEGIPEDIKDLPDDEEDTDENEFDPENRRSEECGESLEWKLDDNGTLTISGIGEMDDFSETADPESYETISPFNGNTDIKKVVIENGVTYVGSNAFYGCTELTDITCEGNDTRFDRSSFDGTKWKENKQKENDIVVFNGIIIDGSKCKGELVIPETIGGEKITGMADQAFCGNDGITSVVVPGTVSTISSYAFSNCENLEKVVLNEGVERIESDAFCSCEQLDDVSFPKSLKFIGQTAFFNCFQGMFFFGDHEQYIPENVETIEPRAFWSCYDIGSFNVSEKNKNYCSIDGVIFSKDKKKLMICPPAAFMHEEYTIPDSVTEIADHAFEDCQWIEKINMNSGLKIIGNYAFEMCCAVTEFVVPEGVEEIGDGAFRNCGKMQKLVFSSTVRKIGKDQFWNCSSIESEIEKIVVAEENQYYCAVDNVLMNKDKTQIIAYPACKPGKVYVVPDTVKNMCDYALSRSKYLKYVVLPDNFSIRDQIAEYDIFSEDITLIVKAGSLAEKFAKTKEIPYLYELPDDAYRITGDINSDDKIDVTDLSMIAAHIKGKRELDDESVADINNDGSVNVTDLSMVAAHIKGIKTL